ncbi:MAG TPA: PAC2 family protein [Actinomycetota bacterium]
MTLYRTDGLPEDLVAPVLVAAFDGWVDAAGAASAAADRLARGGELIATFDADVLYDYRSRRPTLDIVDGTLTRLVWPSLELHRLRRGGRDVLVLHGAEPDFRWRELGTDVLDLCLRLGVIQFVSIGAIPAAVPHTRPTPILANASAPGLLHEAELQGPPGLLRVPSACLSAVELAVTGSGIPSVGFYAQVPHYVGGPFAAATLALLQHLGRHLSLAFETADLETEAAEQRGRLDVAVEADDDVRQLLQGLEREPSQEDVPSGEELAAEIERFLRAEDTGDGGGTIPPS